MTDNTPQPNIHMPENAFTDSYSVELGGHHFTQAQWETIVLYAQGFHRAQLIAEGKLNPMQQGVMDFHNGGGQPVGHAPHPLPQNRIPVRVELIREEFQDELIPALLAGDLVETVDACVDILYVTFGLLVEMGVNAQPIFDEVQASNMSKFDPATGKAIIAGENDPDGIFPGRVKKGPNYFRPNIRDILLSGKADLQ